MNKQFTRRELLASAVVTTAVSISGCQTSTSSDQNNTDATTAITTGTTHPTSTSTETATSTRTETATSTGQEQFTSGPIQVPVRSTVGDPLPIQLTGFESNTKLSLEASATDSFDDVYTKTWSLQTGDNGTVAILPTETTPNPSASTWVGTNDGFRAVDSRTMLLHSMKLTSDSPISKPFNIDKTAEITFNVRVGSEQRPRATQTTTRVSIDSGVTQQPIEATDLVGRLYLPASSGPHPAVMALHGSGGRLPVRLSMMLATHGYATLALKYFGAEGLPDALSGIPLEYFQRAIHWLTAREEVRGGGIGIVGLSRGVEPALLAAADYKGPATVVGYGGSGMPAGAIGGDSKFAWLRNGKPIVPYDAMRELSRFLWSIYLSGYNLPSVPEQVRNSFSATTLERVLIPVEKIDGPVLLFAGEDDKLWPSPTLSVLAVGRLKRRGHPYSYGLSSYTDAGHIIHIPYQQYKQVTKDTYGGTPAANARAAATSWPLLLKCLKQVSQ